MKLANYIGGAWSSSADAGIPLLDPVLGAELARVSSSSVDYYAALRYLREQAGPRLKALTYAERAALLGRIAEVLGANRDHYYRIALENSGSPKTDAVIDVDGAIFTLKYYAKEGAALGENRALQDGAIARLGKDETFQALHLAQPLRGAAILINAFNFPGWGLWEKAAPALLSGVPILVKPASATALLAHRMIEDVVRAGVLPEGVISIVCGSAGNLLDAVTGTDAIAFTGSAETGERIRRHPTVARHSARINIEADSLNVAILGPDVSQSSAELELFAAEVAREMTVKAGQKCTAIRRILVPYPLRDALTEAISGRLEKVVIGDPRDSQTQMGPVVTKDQQRLVYEGIAQLAAECITVLGGKREFRLLGAPDPAKSAFVAPTLLTHDQPLEASLVHEVEVFGPVATVLPYRTVEEAFQIARRGQGSLVASIFTSDVAVALSAVSELGSTHGRVHIVNSEVGRTQTGHGNVMPMSMHGGPGRAGGGQELGGMRALRFYHQLCAVQGPGRWLEQIRRGATH